MSHLPTRPLAGGGRSREHAFTRDVDVCFWHLADILLADLDVRF
jgi:hypothetical protein